MSNPYNVIKALRASGMDELKAEAVANAIMEMTKTDAATKADVDAAASAMKPDLLELRAEVKTGVACIRADLALITKILFPIGLLLVAAVVKLFFA
ncbi:hypothetical protein GTB64_004529 [Salmonella enterica]|nr:hypothetical protein [Salmonella enterica]